MVNPLIERLRQMIASAPADRIARLRAEIAADPDKLRAAVAAEMMRSGAFVSRKRKLLETDTAVVRRSAVSDALRIHTCSMSMLRERWSDAVQNAVGWVWVILASETADWSTAGAIGVGARRCLRPFPVEGCEPEVGPYTQAERGGELMRRILGKPIAKPRSAWDWVDYAASREGLGVRFLREFLRSGGVGSFAGSVRLSVTPVMDDDWERFAGDLPVPPVADVADLQPSGPVSSLRRGSGWAQFPAVCGAFSVPARRQRRYQRCRSPLSNRERSVQWGTGCYVSDRDYGVPVEPVSVVVQSAPAVVRKPHPLRVCMMDDAGLVRYWSVRLQARTLPPRPEGGPVVKLMAVGDAVKVSDVQRPAIRVADWHVCITPPVVPTLISDGVVSNWV